MEESIGRLLAQVCRLNFQRMHAPLEELGLYRGQPFVLSTLWEEEGITHSELSHRLHVQPSTVTNMVKRMERAGFIERRDDPGDERVSRVYLTEAGRQVRQRLGQMWQEMDEQSVSGFSSQERALLGDFLLRLRDNLLPEPETAR
jgi:DNA-binding MarR family transcriptional regulator